MSREIAQAVFRLFFGGGKSLLEEQKSVKRLPWVNMPLTGAMGAKYTAAIVH